MSGEKIEAERRSVEVQTIGPNVILLPIPTEALKIQRIVSKTNELLSSHRDFLVNLADELSIPTPAPKSTSSPYTSLTTPPPSLKPRQVTILPECQSISASASIAGSSSASSRFAISLSSVSSTASITIASLASALSSAQMSASSEISAQSAALASVSSASTNLQSSLLSVMSSASAAISSANSSADQARALATLQVSQAQASIVSINQQAQQMIKASNLDAMNKVKLALVVTFSVLGSSMITALIIYLIIRYRRRRTERRQLALKEKIQLKRGSDDTNGSGPSLSEFPFPVNRQTWSQRTEDMNRDSKLEREAREARMREDSLTAVMMSVASPTTNMERKAWAPEKGMPMNRRASAEHIISPESREKWSRQKMRQRSETISEGSSRESRKTTLVYDADRPDEPPTFMSWLDESMMSPRKGSGEVMKDRREERVKMKSKVSESSIGTAF